MTPKETAEELVNKYLLATPVGFHIDDAKKCALIAVDEIIEELSGMWCHYGNIESQIEERQIYWFEVKTEIEKL